MELIDLNMKEIKKISIEEEKESAVWAAERLNDVYDDNSENEVILSQYNINNKKDFISYRGKKNERR